VAAGRRRSRRRGPQVPFPLRAPGGPTSQRRVRVTKPLRPVGGLRKGPVLCIEREDVEHAEAFVAASDDFLAVLDHEGLGRLAGVGAVLEMEPVGEHRSSIPGPNGEPILMDCLACDFLGVDRCSRERPPMWSRRERSELPGTRSCS
jgi:hypothetical protein